MWSGGFPLYLDRATGNRVIDVDGHEYVDFALGDTGAMAGHSPEPTVDGRHRSGCGDARRDHDDAADRGRRVGRRRAGPPVRPAAVVVHADRDRREPLGDPAGPAGDRAAEGPDLRLLLPRLGRRGVRRARVRTARRVARPGNVGAPGRRSTLTTRVAEFNDLAGVEAQLAHGDVAAILTEPALTNIGIVLPEPGFLDGPARARDAVRRPADDRRDAHLLGRPRRRDRGCGTSSRTSSSSASPSAAASPAAPTASPARSLRRRRRTPTPTPTSSTSAASAAPSPATRCRSPRCAPPSSRC